MKLTEEQIDGLIDDWHGADEDGVSLHEYLGWTWAQYKRWGEEGEVPEQDDTSELRAKLAGGS